MNSVEQLEALVRSAVDAAEVIRNFPGMIRVISHYDADGIASAAIMVKALEREGKEFRVSLVKQLSEDIIKGLEEAEERLLVFTDLGSGFLSWISGMLGQEKKAVILDHHQVQGQVEPERRQQVFHVNPVLNGIDEDISGSGVTYLMSRAMSPVNKDLSELAIIGAIGDSQIGSLGPHWGLLGINKEILKDAQTTGGIRLDKGLRLWGRYGRALHKALQYSMDPYIPGVSGSESGAVQFLQETGIDLKGPGGEWRTLASLNDEEAQKLATGIIKERIRKGEDNPEWIFGDVYELLQKSGDLRDANEFATMLNACGKSGNAWMGIGLCLNDEGCRSEVKKVMGAYRREIGKAVDMVRKRPEMVKVSERADFIVGGEKISEHVIGNVTSIIEKSCLVPDGACGKPVFGLAKTEEGMVKVSARAGEDLVSQGLSMKELIVKVVEVTGGEGGGHAGAAGATIPDGSEETFIKTVEKLLSVHIANQEPESQEPGMESPSIPDNYIKEEAHKLENKPEPAQAAVGMQSTEPLEGQVKVPPDREEGKVKVPPDREEGKEYGREHQGTGTEREGKGREEEGPGREEGREEAGQGSSPGRKEMERQGLVRYLFS